MSCKCLCYFGCMLHVDCLSVVARLLALGLCRSVVDIYGYDVEIKRIVQHSQGICVLICMWDVQQLFEC